MSDEIFHLDPLRRERRKRVKTAQHFVAALLMVFTAAQHLQEHGHLALLPLLEIAAGLVLIVTAIRDRVKKTHSRVGWVEIAGAAMMYVEAIRNFSQPHTTAFRIVSFLPPTILLVLGIFEEKVNESVYLRAGDERLTMRPRLLFARHFRWDELSAFRVEQDRIELVRTDGRRARLNFRRMRNGSDAQAWAVSQLEKRGVEQAV